MKGYHVLKDMFPSGVVTFKVPGGTYTFVIPWKKKQRSTLKAFKKKYGFSLKMLTKLPIGAFIADGNQIEISIVERPKKGKKRRGGRL